MRLRKMLRSLFSDESEEPRYRWVPLFPEPGPIAELPESGLVAVIGRVVAALTTPSWADGSPLVVELWRLYLSEEDGREVSSPPLVEGVVANDFLVEDASGTVAVRVAGARLVLWRERRKCVLPSLPAALETRIPNARPLWQEGFAGFLTEQSLAPGDPVLVVGAVELEPAEGPRGGFRRVIRAPSSRADGAELLVADAALEKSLRKGTLPPALSHRV